MTILKIIKWYSENKFKKNIGQDSIICGYTRAIKKGEKAKMFFIENFIVFLIKNNYLLRIAIIDNRWQYLV